MNIEISAGLLEEMRIKRAKLIPSTEDGYKDRPDEVKSDSRKPVGQIKEPILRLLTLEEMRMKRAEGIPSTDDGDSDRPDDSIKPTGQIKNKKDILTGEDLRKLSEKWIPKIRDSYNKDNLNNKTPGGMKPVSVFEREPIRPFRTEIQGGRIFG